MSGASPREAMQPDDFKAISVVAGDFLGPHPSNGPQKLGILLKD